MEKEADEEGVAGDQAAAVNDMDYSLLAVDMRKLLHISPVGGQSRNIPHGCRKPLLSEKAGREPCKPKPRQVCELEDIVVHKCPLCSLGFNAKELLARHALRIHQKAVVSLLQQGSTEQHLKCRFCVHKVMHRHQKLLLLHLEKKHSLEFVAFLKETSIASYSAATSSGSETLVRALQKGLNGISLSDAVGKTDSERTEELFPCPKVGFGDNPVLWSPVLTGKFSPNSNNMQQFFRCSSVVLRDCKNTLGSKTRSSCSFAKRKLMMDGSPMHLYPGIKATVVKENPQSKEREPISVTLARSGWTHAPGKQFACGRCGEAFSCNALLLDHVRERHRGPLRLWKPLYTCGLCAASFYKNSFLVRHCYQHHTPS